MVRAHDAPEMAGLVLADTHPPMAARVVERVDRTVVSPDDDEGIGVDVEHEVVAGALHLARVAGEEPAPAPDALEVEPVDAGVGLELALERVAGLVRGDQAVELSLRIGEMLGREEVRCHDSESIIARLAPSAMDTPSGEGRLCYCRRRAPSGSYSTSGATSAPQRCPKTSTSSRVPTPVRSRGR